MTNEQKVQAYKMILDGYSYGEIAKKFGCSRQNIQQIFGGLKKPRKSINRIIYLGIKKYMEDNRIGYTELLKSMYPEELVKNSKRTCLRMKLTGESNISVQEAKRILKVTGMTFEEAFRTEEEDVQLSQHGKETNQRRTPD